MQLKPSHDWILSCYFLNVVISHWWTADDTVMCCLPSGLMTNTPCLLWDLSLCRLHVSLHMDFLFRLILQSQNRPARSAGDSGFCGVYFVFCFFFAPPSLWPVHDVSALYPVFPARHGLKLDCAWRCLTWKATNGCINKVMMDSQTVVDRKCGGTDDTWGWLAETNLSWKAAL